VDDLKGCKGQTGETHAEIRGLTPSAASVSLDLVTPGPQQLTVTATTDPGVNASYTRLVRLLDKEL
jgi:hypothetical protein